MRITLTQLMVSTVIGVLPDEQTQPQVVGLDLSITLASNAALYSDVLDDTVDYGVVAVSIRQWAAGQSFGLLERFAGALTDWLLDQFPPIQAVDVSVTKWGCVPACQSVSVSHQRVRA